MAIGLYNGSTQLFDKCGHIIGAVATPVSARSSLKTRLDNMQAAFGNSEAALVAPLVSYYDRVVSAANDPLVIAARESLQKTIVDVVDADKKLSRRDIARAGAELVAQMRDQAFYVDPATVTPSYGTEGTNTGTGAFLAGSLTQVSPSQLIHGLCTADAYTGTEAGREAFLVTTPSSELDRFSLNWPRGSSSSVLVQVLDYFQDPSSAPGQQGLRNGAFDAWTATDPDDWTIVTGASLIAETASALIGSSGMIWTGNGSTFQVLDQDCDGEDDGAIELEANTAYEFGVWLRSTAVPVAGTVKIQILTGAGSELAVASIAASSLTGTFAKITAYYETGDVLPIGAKVRISMAGTALASGKNVIVSCAYLSKSVSIGPYGLHARFVILRGTADFRKGDRITMTIANNWLTASPFQHWFARLLGFPTFRLVLPTTGSTLIPAAAVP